MPFKWLLDFMKWPQQVSPFKTAERLPREMASFISKGVISASNGILRLLKLALSRLLF